MLLGETLKALLVVGACLSAWAAPLGVTSSPQARRCDRTEQGSKETSESLESHNDDELCESSTLQLPASSPPHVKEWREPGRTADVLDNARDEGEVTVADAGKVQIRDSGLFQKEGEQNLSVDNIVTVRSSSVDKNSISVSAGPTESVSSGPGNVNMEVESVTAASAADQINSQNDAVQKVGPSVVPFGQSTGRSAETQVVLGHGEDVRQGSLLYTDLEKDKGRVRMRDLPQEHKREWDVESITKEHFTQLRTTEPLPVVSSTAHDSASQSPWTVVNPVATSPTTPGIPDGEAGRSRVAEENLFTASDLQDKALAPGILQPDLTLSSREPELGGTWTEPLHLQGVEETSISPLSQEVGTEATMSSEDLPLIFEPLDDVTPPSGSAQASELSVAMAPATGMLREAELEQAVSVDTEHVPPDASILGPSDWPSPWQMSGSENSDAVAPYQMPVSRPFSGADLGPSEKAERLQNISASVGTLPLSPSPVPATVHQDFESTQSTALQTKSGLDELESEEDEDEEDEDVDESEEEEEDSEEDLNEATVHTPTRASYSLIPPPPVWGQQNQGLIRSWVELIREKAGYVSGMLVPVGIGIAGALLIVGALYSIRMIHRKRKNSFKHQRRKQPKEVRTGPDQAMLLADSSEDEF